MARQWSYETAQGNYFQRSIAADPAAHAAPQLVLITTDAVVVGIVER